LAGALFCVIEKYFVLVARIRKHEASFMAHPRKDPLITYTRQRVSEFRKGHAESTTVTVSSQTVIGIVIVIVLACASHHAGFANIFQRLWIVLR
jgi:hypothetical protein